MVLTLVLLNPDIPVFVDSVDPDQLASEGTQKCVRISHGKWVIHVWPIEVLLYLAFTSII